ncbi:MAG: NAD kinase [Bacteroidota bacterium]
MKVGIFGQTNNDITIRFIKTLVDALSKYDTTIAFERNLYKYYRKQHKSNSFETFTGYRDLSADCDLFFSVGGDGTFLRSITFVRDLNIPIIGINTGRLGFLATIQKEKIEEAVAKLIKKDYTIINRSVISVRTNDNNKDLEELNFALNEISISRKNTASMITVETSLDNEFLTNYWSDGLIIATPTGSTGYSLSCGGPIISPSSKNFILTPIAPHSLSVRPLVIPDKTIIGLKVNSRSNKTLLTLDSRITTIYNKTKITISKGDFTIKTVQLNDQSFIKTLREKLLWGEDKRN